MLEFAAMTEARRTLKSDLLTPIPDSFIDEAMVASIAFSAVMSADGADFRVRVKLAPHLFLDQDAVAWIDERGAVIVISAIPASIEHGDPNKRLATVFALAAQAYAEAFAATDQGKAWKGEHPEIALARGVANISNEAVAEARRRLCN